MCTRLDKDHIGTLKILQSVSEVRGLRKHQNSVSQSEVRGLRKHQNSVSQSEVRGLRKHQNSVSQQALKVSGFLKSRSPFNYPSPVMHVFVVGVGGWVGSGWWVVGSGWWGGGVGVSGGGGGGVSGCPSMCVCVCVCV